MTLSLEDRIDNYVQQTRYPRSLFVGEDGRIVGVWIMGNSYRVRSGFYGGYPDTYLKRIKALFPGKQRVLHIFSGKVDQSVLPGDTVDINADLSPTYVDDAQRLENVPLSNYDLVLADPPYSVEDAERYQTSMIKRNVVMAALGRLPAGAHVVWLDQVLPMYSKKVWAIEAVIGMVKSTNHRFRVITVFRRLENTCCVVAPELIKTENPNGEKPMQINVTLVPHPTSTSIAVQQWIDWGLRLEAGTAPAVEQKANGAAAKQASAEKALFDTLVATKTPDPVPVAQSGGESDPDDTDEGETQQAQQARPAGALPPGVEGPVKRKGGRPSKAMIAEREAAAAAAQAAVNPALVPQQAQPVSNGALPLGVTPGGGGGARPPGFGSPAPANAVQPQVPAMPPQEEYSNGLVTEQDVLDAYQAAWAHDHRAVFALMRANKWSDGTAKPPMFDPAKVAPVFYDRLYSELGALTPMVEG